MHTPMTQQSWGGLSILLSRHSVGIYQETSSHATHSGTLNQSHLSLLSNCVLIWALKKKKKKVQVGNEWSNLLPKILASEEKAATVYKHFDY